MSLSVSRGQPPVSSTEPVGSKVAQPFCRSWPAAVPIRFGVVVQAGSFSAGSIRKAVANGLLKATIRGR
jgi:hypothetical protein